MLYTKELTSHGMYDILVCGGGYTGFAAAYAAAREGKRVLLIDADSQCNTTEFFGGEDNGESMASIFRKDIENAAALLVPGGHFYMVHRPFRLAEIIERMVHYRIEPKRMQLVFHQ